MGPQTLQFFKTERTLAPGIHLFVKNWQDWGLTY